MNYKFRIDEDYKLIYIVNFIKKENTSIKFEEVLVSINQNIIASSALLQANPEILNLNINSTKIKRIKSTTNYNKS
jgi:lipoate synthase